LARLDGRCDPAVEGPVWNGYANRDALEADDHLSSVRSNGVLVIAVVGPRNRTALTNGRDRWTKIVGACSGEAESGGVEVSDVYDAYAGRQRGGVDGGGE
jgi:hypothetical protein